jgi:photosynthetic reaction center cytochrome c subunit
MRMPPRRPMTLLALVALVTLLARGFGWSDEAARFQNLKVLPKDIDRPALIATMGTFTRALGVRCGYCHVVTEPQQPGNFAKDDKPTKLKARVMMQMVKDINEKYLATLDSPAQPRIPVTCFTCHHGVGQPRTLQQALLMAYATGGLDSTRARYDALRDRYYGRAAYDFGEVPLVDVASAVRDSGHAADALELLDLDMKMNPKSSFAQRMYAQNAVMAAFTMQGADSGRAAYTAMKTRFGPGAIPEEALGGIAEDLLHAGKAPQALAALELNAAEHPTSAPALDALGDAYVANKEKQKAILAYRKAVAADSSDTHALEGLASLHAKPEKKSSKKR